MLPDPFAKRKGLFARRAHVSLPGLIAGGCALLLLVAVLARRAGSRACQLHSSPVWGTVLTSEEQTQTDPPRLDPAKYEYHGCTELDHVCVDQDRFIMFNGLKTPGTAKYTEKIFDPGFTWQNVPGYPDNFIGTKQKAPWPRFRANSTADPPDIAAPRFSANIVPLIWWPIWPENYGEVLLQSAAPLHAMQLDGLTDRNITLVPALDGFELPSYFRWLLQPLTNNRIEPLEELSSRAHTRNPARARCFQRLLLCKTLNMFNYRNEGEGKTHWFQALKPGTYGQQVAEFYRPQLVGALQAKDPKAIKVAIIARKHKRRLLNMDEALWVCNEFKPADGRKMQCVSYDFDDGHDFLHHLGQLQTFDIMIGLHGAALANGIFMRPNTALVEVRPCEFDSDWMDNYFQKVQRIENINLAFKIITKMGELCFPGDLEQRNSKDGLDLSWVDLSFKRDQDLKLRGETLEQMLRLIIDTMKFDREAYLKAQKSDPTYFNTLVQ